MKICRELFLIGTALLFLISILFAQAPVKLWTRNSEEPESNKFLLKNYPSISQPAITSEGKDIEGDFSSIRDEDTLVLDDGTAFDLFWIGKYRAQRFTPGILCTLQALTFRTVMEYTECSLYVWPDSSGIPQSSTNLVLPVYFSSSFPDEWQRIDISTPVIINEDFWIGIKGYSSFFYDNTANCHKRIAHSYDKIEWFIPDYHEYGELLIRPIVKLTGPRHDVSCTDIFSKKGFFLPNPAFDTVGIVVKNFGNVTEDNVPVYLRVKDTLGLVVFFDAQYIDSLKHNEMDTVFIPWSYNKNDDYIIEGYPWISNDCVRDNDKLKTKSYIRTYPCELYYDYFEYTLATTTIDTVANKFFPPYYPCRIDSIRCCFECWQIGTTYTYGIAIVILDDNGIGGFPGTELAKDSVMGFSQANFLWVTMDFTSQNVIVDSGGFFAEWTFIPDSTTPPYYGPQLWTDMWNPPFAHMTWVKRGGIWYHWWEHWDPFIRVWVDYPSEVSENNEKKSDLGNSLSVHPTISNGKFECSFCTSKDAMIDISLYSIDGRRVSNLFRNYVQKGLHCFYPDISDLPQGVYFIRMKGDGFTEKKKLILIK